MATEVTKISEAAQHDQLRTQHYQALARQEQLQRELEACNANVLALTNILGGVDLGLRVASEAAAAKIPAKAPE